MKTTHPVCLRKIIKQIVVNNPMGTCLIGISIPRKDLITPPILISIILKAGYKDVRIGIRTTGIQWVLEVLKTKKCIFQTKALECNLITNMKLNHLNCA